jgi:hypothetical protein
MHPALPDTTRSPGKTFADSAAALPAAWRNNNDITTLPGAARSHFRDIAVLTACANDSTSVFRLGCSGHHC